jgi:hypothetical protein
LLSGFVAEVDLRFFVDRVISYIDAILFVVRTEVQAIRMVKLAFILLKKFTILAELAQYVATFAVALIADGMRRRGFSGSRNRRRRIGFQARRSFAMIVVASFKVLLIVSAVANSATHILTKLWCVRMMKLLAWM